MPGRFALSLAAILLSAAPALAAPPVIENPGRCAAVYPNANCTNYGPGNPYVSYGYYGHRYYRHRYYGHRYYGHPYYRHHYYRHHYRY